MHRVSGLPEEWIDGKIQDELTTMNDIRLYDFKKIANWLRENKEKIVE